MKLRILLISDIGFQIDHFKKLFNDNGCENFAQLSIHCSPGSQNELKKVSPDVSELNIVENSNSIAQSFDLIISYHCRQLFPSEVVRNVRCVNIHPGFNPYNRGWYPGVFSISNGLPTGATIHEIDDLIDNGPIIIQKQVEVLPEDTSGTFYPKIIAAEKELLEEWFLKIIKGDYTTFLPTEEGNLNYKKDYYNFLKLDLDKVSTTREIIDKLRALTHPPYKNAYFIDEDTGDKIYISINVERRSK